MGDPNVVVRICRNNHPVITYSDRRDDPQPCPICGRLSSSPPPSEVR